MVRHACNQLSASNRGHADTHTRLRFAVGLVTKVLLYFFASLFIRVCIPYCKVKVLGNIFKKNVE